MPPPLPRLDGIRYAGPARFLALFGLRAPLRLIGFLMVLQGVLDVVRRVLGVPEHMSFALIRRRSTLVHGIKMPDRMPVLSRDDFDMMQSSRHNLAFSKGRLMDSHIIPSLMLSFDWRPP